MFNNLYTYEYTHTYHFLSSSLLLLPLPPFLQSTILLAYLTAVQYAGFTVMPMAGGVLSDVFQVREGGKERGLERGHEQAREPIGRVSGCGWEMRGVDVSHSDGLKEPGL